MASWVTAITELQPYAKLSPETIGDFNNCKAEAMMTPLHRWYQKRTSVGASIKHVFLEDGEKMAVEEVSSKNYI